MKNNTQRIAITSVLTALLLIIGPLAINVGPVPMTLQTLIVALVASVASTRVSLTAIGLYIVLGALGLPVFAGYSSGFAVLIGPTAGYLWSFLLYAPIIGLTIKHTSNVLALIVANVVAVAVNLAIGTVWLSISTHMSATAAIAAGVTPFVLSGLIKIIVVVLATVLIRQATQKMRLTV
ncbi:biotin transporter BioY [Leuconostoc falkenbergense]|uniref:biotin transporter BioY n=1 Tax=Leuconostoc falkenbergense TaxID=2766470 RepID=UPI0024A7D18F|nr:biotin transporter BioY [Leuconostoc falkenbergense]MDI6552967.1 biotin transporter BioY [Leuconostoc falkenbergense]